MTAVSASSVQGDGEVASGSSVSQSHDGRLSSSSRAKGVGAMVGAVATSLLMTPLDLVKTRLQTRRPASVPPPHPLIHQPFRSLPPALVQCCLQTLRQPVSLLHSRSLSLVSCSASDLALPLPLRSARSTVPVGCKTPVAWLALEGGRTRATSPGMLSEARSVLQEAGVRGLWKGVGTTLSMAVPSSAMYMLAYEDLRAHLLLLPAVSSSPTLSSLSPLLAGSIARTATTTLLSPVEIFRTRLQAVPVQGQRPPTVLSTLASIRQTLRAEGVRGMGKGLGATLMRDVPFSAIYWVSVEGLREKVLVGEAWDASPGRKAMVAGALSGMLAATLTTPLDVVKTRQQTAASGASSARTLDLVLRIARTQGPKALFAGLAPRLAKVSCACAVMLGSFEGAASWLDSSSGQPQAQ